MTLSAGQQTELEKPVTRICYFVELQFSSATVYLSSAMQTLTWGGHDWLGLGSIGTISAVNETEGTESSALTFGLNIADASYLSLALGDVTEYRGRTAKLYFCPLTTDMQLSGTPVQCWRGVMDSMAVGIEGEQGRIELKCETSAYGIKRASSLRLNAAQHKKDYPTDTGLDYLTDILASPQLWMSKKLQIAVSKL